MPADNMKIPNPDNLTKRCTTRGLYLEPSALAPIKRAGIAIAGIDLRRQGSDWGEGKSPTHLLYLPIRGQVSPSPPSVGRPPLHAGKEDLMVFPASSWKRLHCDSDEMEAVYVHVPNRREWLHLDGPTPFVLPSPHSGLIFQLMDTLLRESQRGGAEADLAVGHLCPLLLHYLRRTVGSKDRPLERARE
ncbi:MAG: hypothetical protein ACYTGH_15260 [Planctomycetota bacterium]|jgi:hypothetical protein